MKKLRFVTRPNPGQYDGHLPYAIQLSCSDVEECFHDSWYINEDTLKQLPTAAQKFNVERKHNIEPTEVSDGSNSRHGRR